MSVYDYATINLYNGTLRPGTVHAHNTQMANFFRKYLFEKAMSVFTWTLPETWAKNYFLASLYGWGFIAVADIAPYGVICQHGTLGGYNLYYQPKFITIANPYMGGTVHRLEIGTDCELIRLQPDYSGVIDIVAHYADMMALAAEGIGVNLVNSKLAYLFTARNKTGAESLKKMYDEISAGNPAVFMDAKLTDAAGNLTFQMLNNNVSQTYITDRLLTDLRQIESMFDNEIGIANVNYNKRERESIAEISSNNNETIAKASLWFDDIQDAIARINARYGINMACEWRFEMLDPAADQDTEEVSENDN